MTQPDRLPDPWESVLFAALTLDRKGFDAERTLAMLADRVSPKEIDLFCGYVACCIDDIPNFEGGSDTIDLVRTLVAMWGEAVRELGEQQAINVRVEAGWVVATAHGPHGKPWIVKEQIKGARTVARIEKDLRASLAGMLSGHAEGRRANRMV